MARRQEGSTYGNTYDALGNRLADSREGLQFCYNLANLPSKVEGCAGSGNAGLTLNYGYLSDGTKGSVTLVDAVPRKILMHSKMLKQGWRKSTNPVCVNHFISTTCRARWISAGWTSP